MLVVDQHKLVTMVNNGLSINESEWLENKTVNIGLQLWACLSRLPTQQSGFLFKPENDNSVVVLDGPS